MRFWLYWSAYLLGIAAIAAGAWLAAERIGTRGQAQAMLGRFDVYAASLEAELGKYEYLPGITDLDQDVIALLRAPADAALQAAVNRHLQRINDLARSSALYILDTRGIALAASNWNQPDSFVGLDLSFRPYFRSAADGKPGRFYAIGTTRGEPGYYFANAIVRDGRTLGVAVLKVSLDKLEQTWAPVAENVLVADPDGVVVLSSVPGWKFRTLAPLPTATLARLSATRQYEKQRLEPLGWTERRALADGARVVLAAGQTPGTADDPREFLEQRRTLPGTQWQLILLSDLAPVHAMARNAALIAGFAALSLLLLVLYLQQRRRAIRHMLAARTALERAHGELEQKVQARTADLQAANVQLQREVAERRRAEEVLRRAQDELVQAGKMAALGQMSAGITHELNQPLAAIRTLSDNAAEFARRGRAAEVQANLALIAGLVDRMGNITGQLKSFARKSTTAPVPVPLRTAVGNALFIVERRLRLDAVAVEQRYDDDRMCALCDANRLEQVLVNLFANALDAMAASPVRRLQIDVGRDGGRVAIRVRDSGPGIPEDALPSLFVPFFTTKAPGVGLGLGLAISAGIVRDVGGTIRAGNLPGGGAEFVVELKAPPEDADV